MQQTTVCKSVKTNTKSRKERGSMAIQLSKGQRID
ncbi:chemical-damaging agent resistance protein C, partial [Bacillus velezensis]